MRDLQSILGCFSLVHEFLIIIIESKESLDSKPNNTIIKANSTMHIYTNLTNL